MNKITDRVQLGTFGELLVQLRLLEFDVQAAQPLKDSGNDLIAIRGEAMRAIQVKATKIEEDGYRVRDNLPERYHALAIVKFEGGEGTLYLDQSRVFLIGKDEVRNGRWSAEELERHALSAEVVDRLFPR
jgi:hypothetical protein